VFEGAGRSTRGEEAVLHVIERIVAPLGPRVDSRRYICGRATSGRQRVQNRVLRVPFLARPQG
jgi:hypothetical protein